MKKIFAWVVFATWLGCTPNAQNPSDTTYGVLNSLDASSTAPIDSTYQNLVTGPSYPLGNEIPVYTLNPIQPSPTKKLGFISLTDSYYWSDDEDSVAIEDEYLGYREVVNHNFHTLDAKHRKLFFERKKILESDLISIYDYQTETLLHYTVSDIPLVAVLNPYGSQGAIVEYDYMIGFGIPMKDIEKLKYHSTFVTVGKVDPFEFGGLKPIKWTPINDEEFPITPIPSPYSEWLKNYSPKGSYTYSQDGFEYFVQNLETQNSLGYRHLVVRTEEEEMVVLNQFFIDSEGSYLQPLNDVDESYSGYYSQFTGKLFRNNPPVVFGFLGHSFGCPSIYFLDESLGHIPIQCDNRH